MDNDDVSLKADKVKKEEEEKEDVETEKPLGTTEIRFELTVNHDDEEKESEKNCLPPYVPPVQQARMDAISAFDNAPKRPSSPPKALLPTSTGRSAPVSYRFAGGEFSGDEEDEDEDEERSVEEYDGEEDFDHDFDEDRHQQRKAMKVPTLLEKPRGNHIERILSHRPFLHEGEEHTEFLIKWKNRGYHACSWLSTDDIDVAGQAAKRTRYEKKSSGAPVARTTKRAFPKSFTEPERILTAENIGASMDGVSPDDPDHGEWFLVKWRGLAYDESTWERRAALGPRGDELVAQLQKRNNLAAARQELEDEKERPKAKDFEPIEGEHPFKGGHALRPYQVEGFNWLRFCYYSQRNSILADEMGLGKTVQTVSIVDYLNRFLGNRGPFLIIAPLSTLPHWQREFEGWTNMNTVVYHGNAASREVIRDYEFWYYKTPTETVGADVPKFNVLITTYEVLLADEELIRSFEWQYCAIDEAHRLKNNASKSLEAVRKLTIAHLLLLTGTPLQNNTAELWTLLSLLDERKFGSEDDFLAQFGDLRNAAQVAKLHKVLKPLMLRRMKEHVDDTIAEKKETIVYVELTRTQKEYYRAIFERNFAFLRKGAKASNTQSLTNVVMQLRKVCNSPFLIKGAEDAITNHSKDAKEIFEAMVASSGKMVLLDKLLPHLREGNHRVLIFSQMVKVLDLLEDYCMWRGFATERLDGSVKGIERQAAIDRFSNAESTDDAFVFLLCTRAGGVGINLTAADTVIIYDSDWNPQNDIQAQARCHRIGQEKAVSVYRLITRGTYELEMFERASKKLGLDQAVLTNMEARSEKQTNSIPLDRHEIDSLLKNGAYGVFRDDDEAADAFTSADITQILERNTVTVVHNAKTGESDAEKTGNFARATFAVEENQATLPRDSEGNVIDIDDPNYWEKLMPSLNSRRDPRILNSRRERKKISTVSTAIKELDEELGLYDDDDDMEEPAADDAFVQTMDDDEASGETGIDPTFKWRVSERNRFKSAMMDLGFGRWADIKARANLVRWSERDCELFGHSMMRRVLDVSNAEDKELVAKGDRMSLQAISSIVCSAGTTPGEPIPYEAMLHTITNLPSKRSEDERREYDRTLERKEAANKGSAVLTALIDRYAEEDMALEAEAEAEEEVRASREAAITKAALDRAAEIAAQREAERKAEEDALAAEAVAIVAKIESEQPAMDGGAAAKEPVDGEAQPDTESVRTDAQPADAQPVEAESKMDTDDAAPSESVPVVPSVDIDYEAEGLERPQGFFDDDGCLSEERFAIHLQRFAKKIIRRLEMLAQLGDAVRYWLDVLDKAPYGIELFQGSIVNDDKELLRGLWKHGFGRYDDIHADPELPFLERTNNQDKKSKKSSKLPAWPTAKHIAFHTKRLLKIIQARQSPLGKSKRKKSVGGKPSVKADSTWSRREVQDFYKDLTLFGAPVVVNGVTVWSEVQDRAKLHKKTDDEINRFYIHFLRLCNKTLRESDPKLLEKIARDQALYEEACAAAKAAGTPEPEAPVVPQPIVVEGDADMPTELPLSFQQCKRVMSKILLIATLRDRVLPHPRLEELITSAVAPRNLPSWWIKGAHDVALLRGLIKHGWGQWEDVVRDPELPFKALGDAMGANKEMEKIGDEEAQITAECTGADGQLNVAKKRSMMAAQTRKERAVYTTAMGWPREAPLGKRIDVLISTVLSHPVPDTVVPPADTGLVKEAPADAKWLMNQVAAVPDVGPAMLEAVKAVARSDALSEASRQVVKRKRQEKVAANSADKDEQLMDAYMNRSAGTRRSGGDDLEALPTVKRKRTKSRKYQEPPRDAEGNVIFPIQLGMLTVHSLGKVVTDRPDFHTARYVYAAGFKTSREFYSISNPSMRVSYTCEIIDDGSSKPIFQVLPSDNPEEVIRTNSSSAAWKGVLLKVNEARKRLENKSFTSSVSGPEYFGFAHPTVASLLQSLPGIELCQKYHHQDFVAESTPEKKTPTKRERPPRAASAKKMKTEEEEEEEEEDGHDDDGHDDDVKGVKEDDKQPSMEED